MLNITNQLIVSALFSLAGFILAMGLTPLYTFIAYKHKFWKKQKTASVTGEALTVVNKLHAKKIARNIPTMAGIIGVIAVIILSVLLNLKREQTWLPLAGLAGGAFIGLIDDILNIWGSNRKDAGLRAPVKFAMIIALAGFLAWFFTFKLHFTSVMIPFVGNIEIGYWMVPLFIFAIVATSNAVNISDGLDGLAGGLLLLELSLWFKISIACQHFALRFLAHFWLIFGLTFILHDSLWVILVRLPGEQPLVLWRCLQIRSFFCR